MESSERKREESEEQGKKRKVKSKERKGEESEEQGKIRRGK